MDRIEEMIQNLELLRMHFGDITKTCMANGIIDSTIKAIENLLPMKMPRNRDYFCGCQSVKMHQCIPSSIVAEKTKVIGLECVLEDFARIVVIRRTTYVKA